MKLTVANEPPQPEPLLLPKGNAGDRGPNLNDRKKHPRLNGADLYVARLGSCASAATKPSGTQIAACANEAPARSMNSASIDEPLAFSSSSFSSSSTVRTGSLHEELLNRETSPRPAVVESTSTNVDRGTVRASRPCYRCISYMHSVGIKRVFWTNDAGEWEGGKVRDLVDALDSSMESVTNGDKGGPMGNGVFVTKHEVLMLKRLMGQSSA